MRIDYERCASLLCERDGYLILTHKNPDGDTFGSAIALCYALRALGKVCYVHRNEGATPRFTEWLAPVLAPEGFEPSWIVSVDIADIQLLPKSAERFAEDIFLAIDHHVSHRDFAEHALVQPDAAACGEIIWALCGALSVRATREIAEAIYIAVSTDTSCFLNANTTAQTHRCVSELFAYDIDFMKINRIFFVLKTRARLQLEARLISDMHFYHNGEIAVMRISNALIAETGATEDDMDNISSLARSVEGVEIGVLVRERGEKSSKISMRSSERADVSAICQRFDGGGHLRAAGCTIPLPPEQAEQTLLETIEKEHLYH